MRILVIWWWVYAGEKSTFHFLCPDSCCFAILSENLWDTCGSQGGKIEMPPVTSRRHFRRIVYQRTMFWWLYYSLLWPLVNSLTEKSSFFRVFSGDMHPVVCQATGWSRITHQMCRSTNRVTCIMSNASSIMSIVRMICLLQSGSTAVPYPCGHVPLADRTGYSPPLGDVATYQPNW